MFSEFKEFIAENDLIKAGERLLLAVSGGIDSMVMTDLFRRFYGDIGIAHCNFSLRGNESDEDEKFVRKYSDDHNIPYFTIRFETKSYAKEKGLSVQMAARELRYTWFEEIRRENNYDLIAVAHNLNDNIETLIINLTRGTGLAGLSGMRPSSGKIIRPILFASRDFIVGYSIRNSIDFREDSSNTDNKYIRNKIRHQIIPVLKEINPSIENTLNETAERFYGINELVNEFIKELREKTSEQKEEAVIFNLGALKGYIRNKTILFELLKLYGLSNVQLDDLLKVITGKTGGQLFSSTHRFIKNRKELIVIPETINQDTSIVINDIEELKKVYGIDSAEIINVDDSFEIPADQSIACIDSLKLKFPLIIRKWKAGDHFYPLGMRQKKKLSDYFIDKKYSILVKEKKLILETDGKIVWIFGDRIDNRFRVTKSTTKVLIIKTIKKPFVIQRLNQTKNL